MGRGKNPYKKEMGVLVSMRKYESTFFSSYNPNNTNTILEELGKEERPWIFPLSLFCPFRLLFPLPFLVLDFRSELELRNGFN